MDYKREVQIRLRVEAIFNKEESDFSSKQEFDDFLEEREDIIFNLIEGEHVADMEEKIRKYKTDNADSIARNEARKAEALRKRAIEEVDAGIAGPERADVSGTAAAFDSGRHAEPAQRMDYATTQAGAGVELNVQTAPPKVLRASLDSTDVKTKQTRENWKAMALASGWTPEFQKQKSLDAAFKTLFIVV